MKYCKLTSFYKREPIYVNPYRVANISNDYVNNKRRTRIEFSGIKSDYVRVMELLEEVVAKLEAVTQTSNCGA